MVTIMIKTLGINAGGWYAEVYEDDDNNSGYGGNARVGRWYGSQEECAAVDPSEVILYSIDETERLLEGDGWKTC